MEEMLNLKDLTEEERRQILSVLKKDELVRRSEDRKISCLKQEIQAIRMKSVLRDGDDLSKMCARCHSEFGHFFNRGDICFQCRFRVCSACQESLLNGKWLCVLCFKQRQLKFFLGSWDSDKPRRKLSGADLVKASIKLTPFQMDMNGMADEKKHPTPIPRKGENITTVEYPNDQDKRQLAQLFETYKGDERTERTKRTSPKTRSSMPYRDTDSDSHSSASDREVRTVQTSSTNQRSAKTAAGVRSTNGTKVRSHHAEVRATDEVNVMPRDAEIRTSNGVRGKSRDADVRTSKDARGRSREAEVSTSKDARGRSRDDVQSSNGEKAKTYDNQNRAKTRQGDSVDREHQIDNEIPVVQVELSDDVVLKPPSDFETDDTEKADDAHSISSSSSSSFNADVSRKKYPVAKTVSISSDANQSISVTVHNNNNNRKEKKSSSIPEISPADVPSRLIDNLPDHSRHIPVTQEIQTVSEITQNQQKRGRDSPSPVSFDSYPSSHANSPLPKKRATQMPKGDNPDTNGKEGYLNVQEESRGDVSDTPSDEYVEEALSKVKFRRMSVKNTQLPVLSGRKPELVIPTLQLPSNAELSDDVSVTSTKTSSSLHSRTDSIQSQVSSVVTDRSSEEADIDEIVAIHHHSVRGGKSIDSLLSSIAGSRESILSFYSNAGDVDYDKIPITGDIELAIEYNFRTGTLEIHVLRCRNIAAVDTKRKRSDPYVKTYLLPDKTRSGKRKTKIRKNTLNPEFQETLRYLISKSELESRTLSVTVWHSDRFGRNDFLGEVTINFSYFRLSDTTARWYPLQKKTDFSSATGLSYKGDIFLSLKYVTPGKIRPEDALVSKKKSKKKSEGQLHVMIKECRNLTATASDGFSNAFVKGYLLPDKTKSVKQKTPVIKHDCNPTFKHKFVFDDISHVDLEERCLELTVWDYDKFTSNEFLGGLRLNLGIGRSYGKDVDWMDARGEEISLWQAMIDRPDTWIDGAIMLRPNMDKRKN